MFFAVFHPCFPEGQKGPRLWGRTLLALGCDTDGDKIRQTDVTGKTTEYGCDALDFLNEVWDDRT